MADCAAAIFQRAEVVATPRQYLGFAEWIAWGWHNKVRVRILLGPNVSGVHPGSERYLSRIHSGVCFLSGAFGKCYCCLDADEFQRSVWIDRKIIDICWTFRITGR